MISRYSSRRAPLNSLLPTLLAGASGYDRIAGYFSSSILEVAGEPLDAMAPDACIRIICNSELNPLDVITARAAKRAMYSEWGRSLPDDINPRLQSRLERLYRFLESGRLRVRVLPDKHFGLIHGKAGVVTYSDGRRTAFIGSANESRQAWELNYEVVWTDDSQDGVRWTQEEFEALWHHPGAADIADAVVKDVERLSRRVVIPDVDAWRRTEGAEAASAAIELPVYRRENGLWTHQKYFVRLAFDLHKKRGARLLLADQVGLGKTLQLGLTAKLTVLWGGGNVLVIAPKTLLRQWQEELWDLLRFPSAVWTGRGWEDEQEVLHPAVGTDGLRRCPRKVGLVSSGLIKRSQEARDMLTRMDYECVILDEAHQARRRNLGPSHKDERADPNNLLGFLKRIAESTKSLLLATATPVQLDPIEAWDLLHALNIGNETVLGSPYSRWVTRARQGLEYVTDQTAKSQDLYEAWEWIRDPLPPAQEGRLLQLTRRALDVSEDTVWRPAEALDDLWPAEQFWVRQLAQTFFQQHNPFIRHIVRRTRAFLENEIDPETNEPYIKPVRVRLFGESKQDAVPLPTFLSDAYKAAEEFCTEVARRPNLNSGFLKTILLRRVGSSIEAGRRTAEKMLGPTVDAADEDELEDASPSSLYPLSDTEREKLERFVRLLGATSEEDPKYREVERVLLQGVDGTGPWIEQGCIIFSQYYDSAFWLAGKLSTRLPREDIGLYAGAARSGVFREGYFTRLDRESLKGAVRKGNVRLLIGTDAASEGLNLQQIGTLINLDLPWNPTRLEQRKGRIQRIGQVRDEVLIYNLRYRGSVEDRVHQLLSGRLQAIHSLFGQLPDTLEDAWVAVALQDEESARQVIDAVPKSHPFEMRYDRIEPVAWESCSNVLEAREQLKPLLEGWQ